MIFNRYGLIVVALMFCLVMMQQQLWRTHGSIAEMQRLSEALQIEKVKTAKLQTDNQALKDEIIRLQQSPEAIEGRARSELGMIKKKETFYQIVR